MTQIYLEYDYRRDDHEVNGVTVPHLKNISLTPPEEYEILENGIIGQMSTIRQSEESYYVAIPIPEDTKFLYLVVINESGGGGSYHELDFLYIEPTIVDAIEHVIDYFDNEHNRDDECKKCRADPKKCKRRIIRKLKTKGWVNIETSCYEGAGAGLYKIPLK